MSQNTSAQATPIDFRNPDGTPLRADTKGDMAALAKWHRDTLAESFRRLRATARPIGGGQENEG